MNFQDVTNVTWMTSNCTPEDSFHFLDCNTDPVHLSFMLLKSLALGMIILLTICGNVLVLMAVALSPNLRSSTHYLIVNLAVADLLLGTTVLPFSAVFEITGKWYFGQTFCTIWAAVDVLYCTASILSLCVISLDRYIGVTRPLAYSTIMVGRRTSVLMVLIWVLSITISIGPLLGWKGPPSDDPFACSVNKELGYVLFSVTGSFYLPMFIILFVYWRIYKAAIRQTKFLESGTKTTKQDVTLRIHLGGANGRANSTPDLAIIRPQTPKNDFSPQNDLMVGVGANGINGNHHHHHHHHHGHGGHGSCRGQFHCQSRNLAPLARPELSSSSSHNNEDVGHNNMNGTNGNDPGVVLRVHRGGGKQTKSAYDNCPCLNNTRHSRPGRRRHHHTHGHHQHQSHLVGLNNGFPHTANPPHHRPHHHGSQPNSLTPSPPSSSPERKINPGFGKIAKFRRQKKAAKTLAIVVGVFLLCWFPFFFILPLDALCKRCKVPAKVFDLFFWLGYFNSCLNPFIYACTSREFQRAFRRILCRRAQQRPHVSRAIYRANIQNRCLERHCNGNAIPMQTINHQWS